ncbi:MULTISPECIES: pseudouridine synthase [unclassified Sinorhizobium]|uniref:pseudouridine synthase n=1 Tax=unclassified Sinorhizobium TaxID=2613772 RepID=UPI0024C2F728|nr:MULTISPECIES: pseudouridine synthase [unclassified Sinorhizobium]MDK1375812.1 pseudouridine synthase [Sinorhizobium sp. 6-70]MDK1478590.1 pseudouridine synthase [Sinorhizobium sp. 6-117]
MTSKDKSTRPGGKTNGREKKPRSGEKKTGAAPSAKARPAAAAPGVDEPQRISKILSRAGVASRRDVERMIMEGRVRLNGVVLDTPVVNATLADSIEVDGHPIRGIERTRLWLYHKPAGLVTTNADPEGRPTVFENLPEGLPRVLSIGRLDINTEGLLLLTNDGGLARVLELPSTGWLRRYRVRAHGEIDQEALDRLKDGIAVDGVLYGAIEATLDRVQGSNVWITMGLREGKNREIKNVLGALGLDVNRLIRISYGPFQLGDLPEGHVQEIRGRTLRDQLGPRLIEDAKANFDAPLYNDQPAAERDHHDEVAEDAGKPERPGRREKPEDKRERALARLDTRRDEGRSRDRGERPAARPADRPARVPAKRSRTANVWMAPGARPIAEKKPKSADEPSATPVRRERPEGAPKTKRYGRTKDGLATKTSGKFDPDRKGAAAKGAARPERAPRPSVRRGDEDGDWISASEPVRRKDDTRDVGFDRRRPFDAAERKSRDHGDRPPRRESSERTRAERPARAGGENRAFSGKPRTSRSEGDRPQGREGGNRPSGDRPRGKPAGKPSVGKSPGQRSGGPRGGKPGGGKPGGGKPGGRPGGGKPRGKGK